MPVHFVKMMRNIAPINDLLSLYRLIKLFRRIRPHIVHTYTPKAGLLGMLSARMTGVPFRVHTFTGLIFPSRKGLLRWLLLRTDRLICALATTVVAEGRCVQRDMELHNLSNDNPVQLIGDGNIAGVDLAKFSPVIRAPQEMEKTGSQTLFRLLYVGRLNVEKGVRELLDAIPLCPSNVTLTIVGANDYSGGLPDETIERMKSDPRIRWVGHQSDVAAFLAQADVLVLPSYREGFPNVILQAFAMAIPVIATDVNGSRELVRPNETGWLIPAKNTRALAAAILGASNTDRVELRRLGNFARQIVVERYDRIKYWRKLEDFYKRMLSEHKCSIIGNMSDFGSRS